MADSVTLEVGVKYCGGCNPRYDRTILVDRLQAACSFAHIIPAMPGIDWDAILVLCGCAAQCADLTGLKGWYGRWTVCGPGGEAGVERFLRAAAQQKKEHPYGLENDI